MVADQDPRPRSQGAPRADIQSVVATGRGDDGTTGLLFGGERIRKDDARTEAYGTIDEAVAALGLARAELVSKAEGGSLPSPLAGMASILIFLGVGLVLMLYVKNERAVSRH